MKKLCMKMFSVILVLSAIMFTLSTTTNLFNAKAVTTAGLSMIEGAEVRLPIDQEVETTGIRFTAQLEKATFTEISEGNADAVYFGIEITANGVSKDVVYLVDDTNKVTEAKDKIDFGTSSVYTYTASVLYNREVLKRDLALDARFNSAYDQNKSNAENIQAYEQIIASAEKNPIDEYLKIAYATELTAKAFYRVGDGEKVYSANATTRSIWGVASDAYIDEDDGSEILAEKYFIDDGYESVDVVYETGELDYNGLNADDKIYINAVETKLTDGKLAKSVYSDKEIGDTFAIAVIDASRNLKVLNATLVTGAKVVETQAFYDAQSDTIYYTENGTQKTIAGNSTNSFNYVVDAETSYALADYSSGSLVTNVNYKYANSVAFEYANTKDKPLTNDERGLVGALQPRIITDANADGYVTVVIDYNQQTDVYKGVKLSIETEQGLFTFTDAVIISQMIDNASELDTVFNQADKTTENDANINMFVQGNKYGTITKGVYMLANDIDAKEGFEFDNSAFNFFEGVFDGRGYNIYNLDVSGTPENPGNGLFSAISAYASIQNVGFINVKASYGSVFQGNLFDVRLSAATTVGTYQASDIGVAGSTGRYLGSTYYRKQLGIPDSDTTSIMEDYLKAPKRRGSDIRFATIWSNVYVKVDPTTQRLMGVISRNMPANQNHMNGNNLVIEYLPENPYDTAENSNDGAFPYNYDYTGVYGVLYGGAYDTQLTSTGRALNRYDVPAGYMHANDVGVTKDYYTPTATYKNSAYSNASLLWHYTGVLTNGTYFNNRIMVISKLGLVSSVKGEILATNETAGADQLQFSTTTKAHYYASYVGKGPFDADEKYKLERYDSYADATNAGYTGNVQITAYMLDFGAEEKYWDISDGYLKWIIKNA